MIDTLNNYIILQIEQRLSVCLFVCSPTPPRSFDGSSPNLVGVCRWTSELPLRGSLLKSSMGQRVNGSNIILSDQTTPGWDHTAAKGVPSKRHTASKSLIPSTGIFTSYDNRLFRQNAVLVQKPAVSALWLAWWPDMNEQGETDLNNWCIK